MYPAPGGRKLLLVDDDPVIRKTYELVLRKRCMCTAVASADEALECLHREGFDSFDAVLTDYQMPGGTGLDLLCQVRMRDPSLAVVIITARDEKELVTNSLRGGAYGYLEKGVGASVLLETMERAFEETSRQRALRAAAAAARSLGRSQLKFLGLHTSGAEKHVEVFFQPLSQASGDFVSIQRRKDGRILILASDVSGHDLNAAYQSIYFQGVARGMIEQGASFQEIFKFFNEFLLEGWNDDGQVEFSIAAFGAQIDPATGLMEIINCGFPFPVLADRSGRLIRLRSDSASPLGWFESLPETVFRDAQESFFLFWSDGLDDLADHLEVDVLALAHRVLHDRHGVDALVSGARDDVIVVRTHLTEEDNSEAHAQWSPLIDQIYPGSAHHEIDQIQRFCERSLEVAHPEFNDERLCTVVLCLREALLNGMLHGCEGREDLNVSVRLCFDVVTGELRLEVEDQGPGHDFDLAAHEIAAGEQMLPEHRGLLFIKHLSDSIEFAERGRIVRMGFSPNSPVVYA